jgi:ER lumen protein retaining receptor
MLPVPVLLGDGVHALSVIMFLAIVGIKGNGSGISLKSHVLYLLVFLTRYLDLFISFYSWYNTLMKAFYIGSTLTIITIMMKVEPAKSTYSATQDSVQYWNLVIGVGIFSMLVHLIGGGVLNIKGSSGQEFEVHFENYSWLLFLWTFSVCLEPLAMIPQLYIFFKNRLLNRDVRTAMLLMGSYRMFYIFFWVSRAFKAQAMEHHYLLYFTGVLQVLTYADFFIYHWR